MLQTSKKRLRHLPTQPCHHLQVVDFALVRQQQHISSAAVDLQQTHHAFAVCSLLRIYFFIISITLTIYEAVKSFSYELFITNFVVLVLFLQSLATKQMFFSGARYKGKG